MLTVSEYAYCGRRYVSLDIPPPGRPLTLHQVADGRLRAALLAGGGRRPGRRRRRGGDHCGCRRPRTAGAAAAPANQWRRAGADRSSFDDGYRIADGDRITVDVSSHGVVLSNVVQYGVRTPAA